MGWNSANQIFDPVCDLVVSMVEGNSLSEDQATSLLSTLIDKLQDGDWDTEDESLENYLNYAYVVNAFAERDVFTYKDDSWQMMDGNPTVNEFTKYG